MDQYIDFKIKNFTKYNKKIACFSSKVKKIPPDENLFHQVMEKYRTVLKENPGIITFIDVRLVEEVPLTLIWSKISKYAIEIDKVARINLCCSVIYISNKTTKTFVNSILQVYKPVAPTKLCTTNEEGMKFIMSVIERKK
jgi:hypothetical protein